MIEKHKLLIVDDDDAVIDFLHAKLGNRYDIVSTSTPENVLRLARETAPSLILCDVDMPGMDGGDVSRELSGDAELSDIPVVFLTNLVSPADMQGDGLQIGGRPAISKRAPLAELIRKIESLTTR